MRYEGSCHCGNVAFDSGEGISPNGNRMAAINLRCLPAIDLETLAITKMDGRSF
ncbi:hypothetical protein [Shinella sp. BYT-45]|uniref:hypothetical protein n=1 Tax=Shinella sp. BYT-45 TaxID=3377377 RepID=UPI0039812C33